MTNVAVAFHILYHGEEYPVGYEHINCHLIFDIKMNFRSKARLVAGGHTTNPPAKSTYSGVVSREGVCIAFTIASLNELYIFAADIQNAYFNAPCGGKIIFVCGTEFISEHKGTTEVVVLALYGLRSFGSAFRNHLASCMEDLNHLPCRADPNVWMRKARKSDGIEYYEYMLLYVDDYLAISEAPKEAVVQLDKLFKMQPNSIAPPDIYLGGKVNKMRLTNMVEAWTFSSIQYVQEAVSNVDKFLQYLDGSMLSTKINAPLSNGYRPELDSSLKLDGADGD